MARTMSDPDELNQYPMLSTSHQQRHPGNVAYLGREQSLKYRDLGPYANATTTPTKTTAHMQLSNQSPMQARDQKYPPDSPMAPSWTDQDIQLDHDRDDTHYTSSSAATTPFTSFNRTSDSTAITSLSTLDESPPPSQLPSPQWDSRGHQDFHMPADHDESFSAYNQDRTHEYNHDHEDSSYATEQSRPEYRRSDSLNSEARDEFPPLQSPKTSIFDNRYPTTEPTSPRSVGNFSRPRNASNKQLYEDVRVHLPNQGRPEPSRADNHLNHTASTSSWPRDRGQSISSAQSSATFASLPIRPSLDIPGDGFRNRSRPQNPSSSRPPVSYRADGSTAPYIRDPIPRMASLPTEELRASYRRSQHSASTAQGTYATERSSVATKNSSNTSYEVVEADIDIYADGDDQDDDGYSLDDVLGMYEKGFDDSEPENNDEDNIPDNDSRPATAGSEIRRRTIVLEAMTSPPPIPAAVAEIPGLPGAEYLTRDSASMFRHSGIPPGALSENPVVSAEPDSGELANDDSDSEFEMRRPTRQMTDMTLTMDADRDRYGFRKANQYITKERYDAWNEGYTEYLARRKGKWTAYLKENGLITDGPYRFPPRSAKTKRFVRKGIPPEWRGAAWFYYAGGPAILSKHAGVYDELLKRDAKEVDLEAIERDLHRTFPDNIKFRTAKSPWTKPSRESYQTVKDAEKEAHEKARQDAQKEGRRPETAMISSLRRVLHAFAVYNPRIGYCQSLNFLAGLLLLFVETEEYAFWLLNIITRVYLPGTHEVSLEGANVDLGVLMSSLRESMPAVWTKIGGELDGTDAVRPSRSRRTRSKQAEPTRLPPITLCMTAWFMSCFIGTLPIESTLRVWDIFFYEGSKTLFRIAMTVFKLGEAEIKAVGDPMEIFQVVQTIPRKLIDANGLIDACFKRRNGFGHISQETVDHKRQERRFQVKAEKERVTHGENAVIPEFDGKRKGSLWSRRREVRPHPAEVM